MLSEKIEVEIHFMGVKGRRYKLWWSGNSDGTEVVGVLVK